MKTLAARARPARVCRSTLARAHRVRAAGRREEELSLPARNCRAESREAGCPQRFPGWFSSASCGNPCPIWPSYAHFTCLNEKRPLGSAKRACYIHVRDFVGSHRDKRCGFVIRKGLTGLLFRRADTEPKSSPANRVARDAHQFRDLAGRETAGAPLTQLRILRRRPTHAALTRLRKSGMPSSNDPADGFAILAEDNRSSAALTSGEDETGVREFESCGPGATPAVVGLTSWDRTLGAAFATEGFAPSPSRTRPAFAGADTSDAVFTCAGPPSHFDLEEVSACLLSTPPQELESSIPTQCASTSFQQSAHRTMSGEKLIRRKAGAGQREQGIMAAPAPPEGAANG